MYSKLKKSKNSSKRTLKKYGVVVEQNLPDNIVTLTLKAQWATMRCVNDIIKERDGLNTVKLTPNAQRAAIRCITADFLENYLLGPRPNRVLIEALGNGGNNIAARIQDIFGPRPPFEGDFEGDDE